MAKMLSISCPCCGLVMQTAAMSCPACDVKIEGNFAESALNRLSEEDRRFLEGYLLAGFSIKALEQSSDMGYAAIRSRIDRLIDNYKSIMKMDEQKKAILEKLRTGEITVSEAKQKLEKISGS